MRKHVSIKAEEHTGQSGYCSWYRLSEVLKAAGELRPSERIVSLDIDERGIKFNVNRDS